MTTGSAGGSSYPALTQSSRAAVAARLVEIVTLRHPEGLTQGQLDELTVVVEAQLSATELLHRFDLANGDEPAFTLPPPVGGVR